MYEVSVTHAFAASHAVPLSSGGREPSHRHLWRVTATFRAERLDERMGVVVDFLEVRAALEALAGELEGQDLNCLPELADGRASAERVAEMIARRLQQRMGRAGRLHCVSVTEAPGCSAAYYPDGAG